jgi:acyl carrier protein
MSSSDDIARRVIEILEQHNPIPGDNEAEKQACHYLEAGVIDSFGLVTLIDELEAAFSIRLDMDDMLSEEFESVGGMINVVSRTFADSQ